MVKQIKNKKTETRTVYRGNGNIMSKIDYMNGQRHGKCIEYYENGKIKEQRIYVNDKMHGKCIEYYENGKIKEQCDYVNHKMHGEYIEYFDSGNIKEKTNYVNGIAHGKTTKYYESGIIYREGEHVNGDMCGKFVVYDELGFCTDRFDIDANGEYVTYEKWNRIYGTNGYVTYKQRSSTEMYMYIKEGDIFYCEGRYYEITRGSLKCGDWEIKKSTNLQIRHLEWQLDSAYIEIIDDAKKEIIDCSVYKLKPSGNKFSKFLTAKKNFNITVMNNAELVVKHKEVEQRDKYLEEIIKGIDKKLYPDVVGIKY